METETMSILNSPFEPSALRREFFSDRANTVTDCRGSKMNEVVSDKAVYTIVPITKDDTEKVVHFLRKFFFRDEPLNVAIGLLDEPNTTCSELEEYCTSCIPDGLSVAAVSRTGCFIGVSLNGVITRDKVELEDAATAEMMKTCQNSKFKEILRFLTTIKKNADVIGHYPQAERILDIVILSVDENYRGQGICKALVEKTKTIAKENNISMIKVDCSSYYSSKAVSRLGFRSHYSLPFADYVDSEGNPIFKPEDPHTSTTTYVLPLTF